MTISKKEKILLLVLLVLLISAGYYFFFYRSHSTELANLKEEKKNLLMEYDLLQSKLIAADGLQDKIAEKAKRIKTIADKNYGKLKQENQTVLIKKLARDTGLKIESITYESAVVSLADLDAQLQSKLSEQRALEIRSGQVSELENDKAKSDETPADGDSSETKSSEDSKGSENSGERSEEDTKLLESSFVDILTATINFKGDYKDMDEYLKNVYKNKKSVIVQELSFDSGKPENKSGVLKLSFYGIRELEHFVDNEVVFKTTSSRGGKDKAFSPYDTFVDLKALADTITDASSKVVVADEQDNVGLDKLGSTNTDSNDGKNGRKDPDSKTLESFETFDVFFVGEKYCSGEVAPSTLASVGNKSVRLYYEFENPELVNRANVVFDKNKKMIYSKASSIGISVYTYQPLGENTMGAVLVDSRGEEYEVFFDISPKAKNWIYADAAMSDGIEYPCMVQRIFLQGEGIHQTLKGTVYIDDLRYNSAN